MKAPFNLIKAFSLNSFIVTLLLTIGISQLLTHTLSRLLLERDKHLAMLIFEEEITELEEEDEAPVKVDDIHEEVDEEFHDLSEEIYGAYHLEFIRTDHTIAWSVKKSDVGKVLEDSRLERVFNDEAFIEFDPPLTPETYYSSLYMPFHEDGKIVAALKLYRKDPLLYQDVQKMKRDVYLYCALFGTIFYFAMIFIIVPASRRLMRQHQELIQAKEKLIESQRLSAIGEVCGAVAHGLKNPIANVRAAVQLLSVRDVSEEKRERITSDILHEVDRLTTRLNHLLNFIRPFEPEFEDAPLSDVLQSAVRSLAWKAEQECISFQLDTSANLSPTRVDRSLLEEALLIVLGNAMDASQPQSKIHCQVKETEEEATIIIQDQGKGIPKNILPKIFDQFFTTRSKGIGLGLALCKKIIDIHKGRIHVESEDGKGTTVYLNLPKLVGT